MDKIPLPEYEAVPIENVAPDLTGLRILFVNVFGVKSATSWTLIDAGLPFSAGKIRGWAEEQFGNVPPQAIVLTHGHFDHVGAIEDLLKHWQAPVYAHPLEMPFLTGQAKYPPPDASVGGGLMAVMSPLYPRGPINIADRVRALPDDGSIPGMPGWSYLHTPGHTQGHVSLFRDQDRLLLVGDAFCTTKTESFLHSVGTQTPELHGPPAYYTPDWTAARRSVEKLASLEPRVLAPGHGMPMAGADIPVALQRLATEFQRVAVPNHKTAA